MNLPPPPARTGNNEHDIDRLYAWSENIYEFLKYPVFHAVKLYPRASKSDRQEGDIYYDSDTDKLTLGTSSAWETVTST